MEPILEIRDLSLDRRGKQVLRGMTAVIPKGSVFMIIGPSGSGKSTLLRTLNRLLEPAPRTIFLDGQDITRMDVIQLRQRVGMLFQQPAMFDGTVGDNIVYGPELQEIDLSDDEVARLLTAVSLEPELAQQDASQLSGGQAQRVALARTLATRPEVLLLDEPTSALDPHATRQVEDTLLRLNQEQGITLIWVSHAIEQTRRINGAVLLLNAGQVVDCGSAHHVLDPEGDHQEFLAFAAGEDMSEFGYEQS